MIVLVCPMCMEHYGVAKDEILAGLKASDPETMDQLLFRPGTQTLGW